MLITITLYLASTLRRKMLTYYIPAAAETVEECFLRNVLFAINILPQDVFKTNVRNSDHLATHIYRKYAEQSDDQRAPSSVNPLMTKT